MIDIGKTITVSTAAWKILKVKAMNDGVSIKTAIDQILKITDQDRENAVITRPRPTKGKRPS